MSSSDTYKHFIIDDYREILDSINDAIFIHDLNTGVLLDVNHKTCEMYRCSREEALMMTIKDVSLDEHPYTEADAMEWMKKAANGEPQLFEWLNKDKQGRLFWVEISLKCAVIAGRKCLLSVVRDINKRKEKEAILQEKEVEEALRTSEVKYRNLVDSLPESIFEIDLDGNLLYANPNGLKIFGYTHEDLVKGINVFDCIVDNQKNISENFQYKIDRVLSSGNDCMVKRKDGTTFPVIVHSSPIIHAGKTVGYRGFIIDNTERKKYEKALAIERQRLYSVLDGLPAKIFLYAEDYTIRFANRYAKETYGDPEGRYCYELIHGKTSPCDSCKKRLVHETQKSNKWEYTSPDGTTFEIHDYPFVDIDGTSLVLELGINITERKRAEEKLKYMSMHDALTGLYNRVYFESLINQSYDKPVGIIVCDVDGLKIVNDAMGHKTGDALLLAAADILSSSFGDGDIVCRIGGDEFAVLLPGCTDSMMREFRRRINNAVAEYNEKNPSVTLSMSAGYSLGESYVDINRLFKEADNNMYREKLHRSQSVRSAIVNTLMKALEVRDYITEGHADRLQDLAVELGKAIGLPGRQLTDLRLLAKFHDIGKVGVPDRILFKPGRLTPEEMAEMKRHSEIGHRIAQSAPDLTPIADWILKHHEWWDGSGYPLGLKEEEIPLACRIIAIADAYDAMTSDRPYRKAMSKDEAINEIIKYTGIQFDKRLVEEFIGIIKK